MSAGRPLQPFTGPSPGAGAYPYSPPPTLRGGGPDNNYGQFYGTQVVETWVPGAADRRPLLDTVRAESLWRVTVTGDVLVYARWGTSGTHELTLNTPIDCTFPGFASVEVAPRVEQHEDTVRALVSLTPVWGGGKETMRALRTGTLVSPFALEPEACRLRAIDAAGCGVTIQGIVLLVPYLGQVELLYPSVITDGNAIVEYIA